MGPARRFVAVVVLLLGAAGLVGCEKADPPRGLIWPVDPVDPALVAGLDRLRAAPAAGPREGRLVELTAYRPQGDGKDDDPYHPFVRTSITTGDDRSGHAYIRINGDDDNDNGVADRDETRIRGEDDLIEVRLARSNNPADGASAVTLDHGDDLRLWRTRRKEGPVPPGPVDVPAAGLTLWVEWTGAAEETASLEAILNGPQRRLDSERLIFETLESAVFVIGGLGRIPPDDRSGVYVLGRRLYELGYGVHMIAQGDVDAAERVAREAITRRGVRRLAALGHSVGAFDCYELMRRLARRSESAKTSFEYSASIDGQRFRRFPAPPLTRYHVVIYQRDYFARGLPIPRPEPGESELVLLDATNWDGLINHRTIDNHALVHAAILFGRPGEVQGLTQRMRP